MWLWLPLPPAPHLESSLLLSSRSGYGASDGLRANTPYSNQVRKDERGPLLDRLSPYTQSHPFGSLGLDLSSVYSQDNGISSIQSFTQQVN